MKNIFIKTLILILPLINYSQIITNDTIVNPYEVSQGTYLKDSNNTLNLFEGTWIYTGMNESITIKLRKITHFFNGKNYEDLLIGEYSLERNGVVLINTLTNFNTDFTDQTNHTIYGNEIDKNTWIPTCIDCLPLKIQITYKDIITNALGRINFGLLASNPNQAKVYIYNSGKSYTATDPHDIRTYQTTQHTNTIPNNWYVFTKQ